MKFRIISLLLSFFICINFVFAANEPFIILIDAGSSGSRLHLFQIRPSRDLLDDTHFPVIRELMNIEAKPGIANYAEHPELASASLLPLINQAKDFLSSRESDLDKIPLYLLATGGMRLLPDEVQESAYEVIKNDLSSSGFDVKNVETISGQMEGVYGWIALNYLEGNFRTHHYHLNHVEELSEAVLDIGGASSQITFAVQKSNENSNLVPLHLGSLNFTLFSHSFLGLGFDQARHGVPNVACYPTGYSLNGSDSGTFNYSACYDAMIQFLLPYNIANGLSESPSNEFYHGISAPYYVMDFFHAKTIDDLINSVHDLCEKNTWAEIKAKNPQILEKYLSASCFEAVYLAALLTDTSAYHFPSTQTFHTLQTVNGNNVSWPIGAALYFAVNEVN